MLFSKVWMFLLAVALAAAFGIAFLAPRPAAREATKYYAENLDRAQHSAQLMLRLEARKWMDIAAKVAVDRTLIESLEKATDGTVERKQIEAKINNRVVQLLSVLKREQRPEVVMALDIRGKQIYRMGTGDSFVPGKHGLIGYPLVEDSLRGYRRDDLWNLDGKLFLVAGTPIISRARGRYVGALVLGTEINDAFARRFKKHLGELEVSFYLRGKRVGSTSSSAAMVRLPTRFGSKERQREVAKNGRTATVLIQEESSLFYTIMTPLPGEAGLHDAFYAVSKPPPPTIGLPEAVRMLGASELSPGRFPWLLLGGGLVAVLVVGFLLMFWEVNLPFGRLHSDLKKLAKGEALRMDSKRFSGKFGLVVNSINKGLERAHNQAPLGITRDQPPEPDEKANKKSRKDRKAKAKAGKKKAEAKKASGSMPPMAEVKPAKKPRAIELDDEPGQDDQLGQGVRSLDGLDDPEDAPTELQTGHPDFDEEDFGGAPPEVSQIGGTRAPKDTDVSEPLGGGAAHAFGEPEAIPGAEVSSGTRSGRKIRIPESEKTPFTLSPGTTGETLMSSVPENIAQSTDWDGPPPTDEGDLEGYMGNVFKEFMSVKRQCGEDISNLTYERFKKKLTKNRKALMERYECRTVKFQVYIKDGKAALKATPIKE